MEKRVSIEKLPEKIGQKVTLCGWVNSKRDHGKVVFADLRDRSGCVQLVGDAKMGELREEDVVCVEGKVVERNPDFVNPKSELGKIEVQVERVTVLSQAEPLPFDVRGSGAELDEETRLRYRYLDLRRPRLRKNLELRHQAAQAFRHSLTKRGFWEIETPCFSKSTPEGARDFLIPSRLQPGQFYALPQSPQQYKQLLMVAGIERYFQIARCFRDEDLRSDRQFEFTQVDVEMSFVGREDVLALAEEVIIEVMKSLGKKIMQKPFPRLTYTEAMAKYHDDKFDLRSKKDADIFAFAWVVDFPLFEKTSTKAINPTHHPFTAPNPEDIHLLNKEPLKVRSWQYDLVCNGAEIGGGSIRITDPKVQEKIFRLLGHSQKEIRAKFGHLLDAFKFGVPPHGGIAFGFDRIVKMLAAEETIREVIAFPMTARGRTAVMEAPSRVDPEQLADLGIKTISAKKK